ncbi:MAG: NAD-dependent protein deacylase [Clostridia bacterium]|nr:NAD-dependent protein deacylase [Clostridia bacterium]
MTIEKLQNIIDISNSTVFFGGAGVSTESGLPDFRSPDGIYMSKQKYPPETMLSHTFFMEHTEEFWDFYRNMLYCPEAKPNAAHTKLAELEKAGKLTAVITQNIDGLHSAAGSKNVFELHGSALRNYCMKCGKFYSGDEVMAVKGIPKCTCDGTIKPDVVLYEESLDDETVSGAINAIASADTLIVAGTSLTVYPAAGFIRYFRGKNLILINRDKTAMDSAFSHIIHGKVGEIMNKIKV